MSMDCPICDDPNEGEYCEHFVLMYDCTFPYASGESSCALDVMSQKFDTVHLEQLVEAVKSVVPTAVNGGVPKRLKSQLRPRVVALVNAVAEYAEIDDGDLQTDSYVDLRAYRDYIETCLNEAPTKPEETYFEDSIPCASSAYSAWWSEDAGGTARYIEEQVGADVLALRGLAAPQSVDTEPTGLE